MQINPLDCTEREKLGELRVKARLNSTTGNAEHVKILDGFNKKLTQITRDLENLPPDEHGEIALFGYVINLFWLDLGQLLYALHRGHSVFDGLSAMSNLTFGTQDFWTEAGFADRQGLTKRHWHPSSTEGSLRDRAGTRRPDASLDPRGTG